MGPLRQTLLHRFQLLLLVVAVARFALGGLALGEDACVPVLGGECCEVEDPCGDSDCPDDHEGESSSCAPGCDDCHCCPHALVAVVPTAELAVAAAPVNLGPASPDDPGAERDLARIDRPPRC